MADEPQTQNQTPETGAEPSAEPVQEPRQSLLQRFLSLGKQEERGDGASEDGQQESPDPTRKPLSELSDAELDALFQKDERMARRVQAETDRREARRKREDEQRRQQEAEAEIEDLLNPESPNYDPYLGAQKRAELKGPQEAKEHLHGLIRNVGDVYDQHLVSPIVQRLADADRERILAGQPENPLEARKYLVEQSLEALLKQARAEGAKDAEKKLRTNDAFRKQLLVERRETEEEPDLVPAQGHNSKPSNISDWMRQAAGRT